MKIHEYQAKALFRRYNIPVPDGKIAKNPEEAVAAINETTQFPVVIKGQIHAGGRGKGGGVLLCHTNEEAVNAAKKILGMNLVTVQTGSEGQKVRTILIESGQKIRKEFYLSILPDRESESIMLMASTEGGMDIEYVAENFPDKIVKVQIDPVAGIQPFQIRELGFGLQLKPLPMKKFSDFLNKLFDFFYRFDCSLVEINPLVETEEGEIIALDAKVEFDDNALYRHKDILEMRDVYEEAPLEVEASGYGLNYIRLDGNIGNIVNGAGLAMATMDLIKKAGANPANFLDVGGGATSEMVENAFRIILQDKNIKGIFINIFGGILRCDRFAMGVVRAAEKTGISIPVIIRMEGTNVEEGRKILADSGLRLQTAFDLKDAAQKVAAII
jgi:succinyl-CoA synthetase beta subunit